MTRVCIITAQRTAELVKAALRRAYPSTQWQVTLTPPPADEPTLAPGQPALPGLSITWSGGPSPESIKRIALAYSSAGYDPLRQTHFRMIRWLLPDGSTSVAYAEHLITKHRYEQAASPRPPRPNAILAHFLVGRITLTRRAQPALVF